MLPLLCSMATHIAGERHRCAASNSSPATDQTFASQCRGVWPDYPTSSTALSAKRSAKSAYDGLDRSGWVHASKPLIEALILVCESLVIDSEQVKQCGLEVADMNRIFDDVVGELVGFTMDDAPFGSAAGHP
jgi:hypothetical protein